MKNNSLHIIGHHGTSATAAKSILAGAFRQSKDGRYGPGVYFWCDPICSACMAKMWATNGDADSVAVLRSKIRNDSMLDLIEHKDEIDKIANLKESCDEDIDRWSSAAIEFIKFIEKATNDKPKVLLGFSKLPDEEITRRLRACPNCYAKIGKSAIVRDVDEILETTKE